MPRIAVGDLLVDVDVPDGFKCEYSLTGSLLARSDDGELEISSITAAQQDGTPADFSGQRERPDATTYKFGYGDRLLIATHSPHLASLTEYVLGTVGPAHDAFDEGDELQVRPLRPSIQPWLAQRRRSLKLAIEFDPKAPDAAQKLDEFWEGLFTRPPREDVFDVMFASAWVAFGDLLGPLGFNWCVSRDEFGTELSCIALPETAKVLIVPASFVSKRWQRRETRFVVEALAAIGDAVREAAEAHGVGHDLRGTPSRQES